MNGSEVKAPAVDFDAEIAQIKAQLEPELADFADNDDSVNELLESSINNWKTAAAKKLSRDTPFAEIETQMGKYSKLNPLDPTYNPADLIDKFELFCLDHKAPFDKGFWQEHLMTPLASNESNRQVQDEVRVTHVLLLTEWKKILDKASADWDKHKVAEMREELLEELKDWLKLVKSLSKSLKKFGLDAGIWLDIKGGSLTEGELNQLHQWSVFLEKDEGARKIGELLGRMRQTASSEKVETIKQSIDTTEPVIDRTAKEEIIGTHLGQDIEHALPHELALLSDPETGLLFDLKFLEAQLLSFQMQGEILKPREDEIEVERAVDEEDKLGPMILCIDTSGSMQGQPEEIAKAMALFLSSKAQEQGRACYLINFSNDLSTFDLTGSAGLSALIKFLSQSFHGGTDVGPAFDHALSMMATKDYEKADVLVMSDFVMGELPEETLADITEQRKRGNRFNSLVIGNDLNYEELLSQTYTQFDKEWIYNPDTRSIHELVHSRDAETVRKLKTEALESMALD